MVRRSNRTKKLTKRGGGLVQSTMGFLTSFVPSKENDLLAVLMKENATREEIGAESAKGADVNVLIRGQGILHRLVGDIKYRDNIEALLDSRGDANINLRNSDGETPLIVASKRPAFQNIELLLQRGADKEARDNVRGATALWWASYYGLVRNVDVLVRGGANGNVRDNKGDKAIDMIWRANENFNRNQEGPFYLEEIYTPIVNKLCQAGAIDETCDVIEMARRFRMNNQQPLLPQAPKKRGSYEQSIRNIPRQVIVNEKSGEKASPTNSISWENIQNGNAMVNFNDEFAKGHYYKKSTFNNYVKSALNKKQAPVNPMNPGKTITEYDEYKARLINGGGLVQSALGAVRNQITLEPDAQWHKLYRLLIDDRTTIADIERQIPRVADLNKSSLLGAYFLHTMAVDDKYNTKLVLLINSGADVNIRDKNGNTPLILATQSGSAMNVETLIEKGADKELRDKTGATAIWWASYYGLPDIVKALQEAGAQGDIVNNNNESAMDVIYNGVNMRNIVNDNSNNYENTRDTILENTADITLYLCKAGSRNEACPEVLESNRILQERLDALRRAYERASRTQEPTEVNIGNVHLPREVVINETTGEKQPIRNQITMENIENGNRMVNFHDEMKAKRFYKQNSFNLYKNMSIKQGKEVLNPSTREPIREITKYTARISGGRKKLKKTLKKRSK